MVELQQILPMEAIGISSGTLFWVYSGSLISLLYKHDQVVINRLISADPVSPVGYAEPARGLTVVKVYTGMS